MTFANPSYLWALTGLAIPLAIHLLSRKEGKVIRVGSIRHVEESNTSQFKSIRLNEVLLLLLRALMISIVVLFMADAQCSGPASAKKLVYIERGMNVDSLKGYEVHEIPKGNYWGFVEELNRSPFETLVISYSKIENFRGQRIQLNDNIKWITAESKPAEFQALAWSTGDSVFVREASSTSMKTSYRTTVAVPDSLDIVKPHTVSISTDNAIVLAALNVLKKEYNLPIEAGSGQSIVVAANIGPLVERTSPTQININKPLDQDLALDENLVIELFKTLYPELQHPVAGKDARVLPDEFILASLVTSSPRHLVTSSLDKYLAGLFLFTLFAERFVAIRRNQ